MDDSGESLTHHAWSSVLAGEQKLAPALLSLSSVPALGGAPETPSPGSRQETGKRAPGSVWGAEQRRGWVPSCPGGTRFPPWPPSPAWSPTTLGLPAGPSHYRSTLGLRVSKEPPCCSGNFPESGAVGEAALESEKGGHPASGSPLMFWKRLPAGPEHSSETSPATVEPDLPKVSVIDQQSVRAARPPLLEETCVRGRAEANVAHLVLGQRSQASHCVPWAQLQNPEWAVASPSRFKPLDNCPPRVLITGEMSTAEMSVSLNLSPSQRQDETWTPRRVDGTMP